MPTASERAKNKRGSGQFGGSELASNETPVSSTSGAPRRKAPKARAHPGKTAIKPAPSRPGDYTQANGRDDPSLSEHDHEHQKLRSEAERRLHYDGQGQD
ncbi:MAG: hypothetical protein GC155_10905 [Alphaproteobacteria bacterium]|nr:hypothetical protein [Alphaproteobacteria bacterium]